MARLALDPAHRRIGVEEFLAFDLRGAKAELIDGLIYMMAGGSEAHARIAGNVFAFLRRALRGSGCRPYNSDFAVRTAERNVRFPDVSVYCDRPVTAELSRQKLLGDPQVIVEVLSRSTSTLDQRDKLAEYQALPGVREILFVDPERERARLLRRTDAEGWTDNWLPSGNDVELPSLRLLLPHAEMFATD